MAIEIRLEWGMPAVELLDTWADCVIVVDVLSFCTSLDIATARGAHVHPFALGDKTIERFASARGAQIATRREGPGYSLSPTSLLEIKPETRLVLPSPNGGALCCAVQQAPLLAGCLRNSDAIATAAKVMGSRIAVIPAGEQWSDGSPRFAVEDLLGAGAIIHALMSSENSPGKLSPEARSAVAAFLSAAELGLHSALLESTSGLELTARGFADDIDLSSQLNTSACAPFLAEGGFLAYNLDPVVE
jgi:2-phosphosulfolactate phosphatase